MKVAEYKQTGTCIESYTVTVPAEYDEEGNLISEEHEETRTREVPVMGMVYRDMTPEEIAELEKIQTNSQKNNRLSKIVSRHRLCTRH